MVWFPSLSREHAFRSCSDSVFSTITHVLLTKIFMSYDWNSHTLPATLTSQTDIIQVALITNGVLSFIDLLYLNPETWKLSDSIQMGLNSGLESDSFPLSYFTLPNMPSGVDNVWGNTGAPGEWFFRVDTTGALQPQRMLLILATFITILLLTTSTSAAMFEYVQC